MTTEEEVIHLKERMAAMERSVLRIATLVAVHLGVPEEDIDQEILKAQAEAMRDRKEI
jgi:hypothetical protein